jgi:deoxyinosine 3'endonuclease (endonuclease V)
VRPGLRHSCSLSSHDVPHTYRSRALRCDVIRSVPIAVLDVSYASDIAGVACLLADTWTAATPAIEISRCLRCAPADYIPGEFYKRELPLLRAVIDDLLPRPALLVIDGYVWLGATHAPGLGRTFVRGPTVSHTYCRCGQIPISRRHLV